MLVEKPLEPGVVINEGTQDVFLQSKFPQNHLVSMSFNTKTKSNESYLLLIMHFIQVFFAVS